MKNLSVLFLILLGLFTTISSSFGQKTTSPQNLSLANNIKTEVQGHEYLGMPQNAVWITRAVFSADGQTVHFYTGSATSTGTVIQAANVTVNYASDMKSFNCKFSMNSCTWTVKGVLSGRHLQTTQVCAFQNGNKDTFTPLLYRN